MPTDTVYTVSRELEASLADRAFCAQHFPALSAAQQVDGRWVIVIPNGMIVAGPGGYAEVWQAAAVCAENYRAALSELRKERAAEVMSRADWITGGSVIFVCLVLTFALAMGLYHAAVWLFDRMAALPGNPCGPIVAVALTLFWIIVLTRKERAQ